MAKHPMQPLEFDKEGIIRFKQNAIVKFLIDQYSTQVLNYIYVSGDFPWEDYKQFVQLSGHRVSSCKDMKYATDEEIKRLDQMVNEMTKSRLKED